MVLWGGNLGYIFCTLLYNGRFFFKISKNQSEISSPHGIITSSLAESPNSIKASTKLNWDETVAHPLPEEIF
jgi:hypothetical protein